MSDVQQSWNKMYNEHTFTNDSKSCVENYEDFSKTYEAVSATLGFSLPKYVADLVHNEVPNSIFANPDAVMLDVAAGTGLIGDGVREKGFVGTIDGLDGSKQMMVKAEEKGHYRSLIQHLLLPNTQMPVMDNSYDILTCVAALSTGHIQPIMLHDMLRSVKPGGHIIFTVRDNITAKEYVKSLKELVKQMEDDNQWRQVSLSRVQQYAVNCATPDDPKATKANNNDDNGAMYSLVYHYTKT